MSEKVEHGSRKVDFPRYDDAVVEMQPGPRSVRFFKSFVPLMGVNGYKKLKAIYYYSETKMAPIEDKSLRQYTYLDRWDRWCFGPESNLLLQDLQTYLSRNWLSSVTDLKRNEPIHHRYYLSPLGFSKFTDNFVATIIKQAEKLTDYDDFVTTLITLNSLPTACVLGLSIMFGGGRESGIPADPEGEPRFRERLPLIHFDQDLCNEIRSFYRKMLKSENVSSASSEQGFDLSLKLEPEVICPRYEYLRFDEKSCIEAGKKKLRRLMQQKMVPTVLFEKIDDLDKRLETKFEEIVGSIDKQRLVAIYERLITELRNICKATIEKNDAVTLRFYNEQQTGNGVVELYLDEGLDCVKAKDLPLQVWHALQPLEVSWLISIYGKQWLSSRIL